MDVRRTAEVVDAALVGGLIDAQELPSQATALLAGGATSVSLGELAGLDVGPVRVDTDWARRLWAIALGELGVESADMERRLAQATAVLATAEVRRFTTVDRLGPRWAELGSRSQTSELPIRPLLDEVVFWALAREHVDAPLGSAARAELDDRVAGLARALLTVAPPVSPGAVARLFGECEA